MKIEYCFKRSDGDISISCDDDVVNEMIYYVENKICDATNQQDFDKVESLVEVRKALKEALEKKENIE